MGIIRDIKNQLVGRALEKCKDPFEEGKVNVMFNFCLVMLVLNIPYTVVAYDHFIGHFISGIVENSCLLFVLIWLNRGFRINIATNIFFTNFILQHLYHFATNNGALLHQGVLFLVLLALFAFFLYGRKIGWITFILIAVQTCVGIYNNITDYSLFHFPEDLGDPLTSGKAQFSIIIPFLMNAYLVSEFVSAQSKAKKRIYNQNKELIVKNQEVNDSITYAKRIQSAILPPPQLVQQYLPNSFIIYKPKDIVAGDFYWIKKQHEMVLIAAADCTGHGVPGAMVSVICNGSLNRSVNEFNLTDPGQILDQTRKLVIKEFEKSEEEVKDGMDIALIALDSSQNEKKSTKIKYAGAHNPLWIIRKGANHIEEIKADRQPVGKFDAPSPFTTHHTELNQGDTIYIFSDGFADQFGGPQNKKFKSKNFKELLISLKDQSIDKQGAIIDQKFEEWRGQQEQIDDVCIIGIRV